MSATIHSLAPEVLDHVLDLVRGPAFASCYEDYVPRNKDLLAAALVCRVWAETAQRVLWRDARITLDQANPRPTVTDTKYSVKHLWIAFRGFDPDGLKHLNLESGQTVPDPIDYTTPFPFHLTHLGLSLYSDPPSRHLVHALFSSSRNTLTSLQITMDCDQDWQDPEILYDGIAIVSPTIETLELDFRDSSVKRPTMAQLALYTNLSSFTKLKNLGIFLMWRNDDLGEAFPATRSLQQLPLPATLTHLTVDIVHPSSVKQITDALTLPSLALLERIDLVNLDAGDFEAAGEGAKLIEVCEERGISQTMSATIHSLAPELLDHILDLVRGPGGAWTYEEAPPSNDDLLSAALVCRLWAETAQRVLWRDTRIILDQDEQEISLPSSKYQIKSLWISTSNA
ncbi:hypothetical protein RQP46_003635 [Phenoliferia psychrophenolica]